MAIRWEMDMMKLVVCVRNMIPIEGAYRQVNAGAASMLPQIVLVQPLTDMKDVRE